MSSSSRNFAWTRFDSRPVITAAQKNFQPVDSESIYIMEYNLDLVKAHEKSTTHKGLTILEVELSWAVGRARSRTGGRIRFRYIVQPPLFKHDLSEHLECSNRLIGRLYRKINDEEPAPVTTFTHYFMTVIVNDTTSNSILSWRSRHAQGTLTPKKSYQGL